MAQRHLLLFSFCLTAAAFLLLRTSVLANWILPSSGNLSFISQGTVLGQNSLNSNRTTAQDTHKPTPKPTTVKLEVEQTENEDTQEPEETESVEITQEHGTAVINRNRNKIEVEVRDENGEEVETPEVEESDEFEIEDSAEDQTTTIRSNGNAYEVIRNKITAQTHFPLMVNLETHELIVTTPHGTKVVTVLPDAAVEHMLAANVLDQLGGKGGLLWLQSQPTPTGIGTSSPLPTVTVEPTPTAEPSVEPSASPSESPSPSPEETPTPSPSFEPSPTPAGETQTAIQLVTTPDGTLVYEISGTKNKKFLGIWKITLQRTAIVSAETGGLISINENLLNRLLDLLST